MDITVLCTNIDHPVNIYLEKWVSYLSNSHNIQIVRSARDLSDGHFLFLVSCSEILTSSQRSHYDHTLVLHAGDVPKGRGWSPHVWKIIHGDDAITLSLLEAEDQVDTGRVWLKKVIPVEKTALWNDVNDLLFEAEIQLMTEAIERVDEISPMVQDPDIRPGYYRKRNINDSQIDPSRDIASQFDLIRMCDPNRYPAWFKYRGVNYKIKIERFGNE